MSVTWQGSEFQSLASAAGNARSPSVERRIVSTSKVDVSADQRWRCIARLKTGRMVSAKSKVAGAVPWRHTYFHFNSSYPRKPTLAAGFLSFLPPRVTNENQQCHRFRHDRRHQPSLSQHWRNHTHSTDPNQWPARPHPFLNHQWTHDRRYTATFELALKPAPTYTYMMQWYKTRQTQIISVFLCTQSSHHWATIQITNKLTVTKVNAKKQPIKKKNESKRGLDASYDIRSRNRSDLF